MTNWQDEAACVGHDPELWWSTDPDTIDAAKNICASCPVIDQCRTYARRLKVKEGVWAGRERKQSYE